MQLQIKNFILKRVHKGFTFHVSRFKLQGFTLIEMLVVIALLIILALFAIPSFYSYHKEADLTDGFNEIALCLRLAQSKALASEELSQWGVYFDQTASPHQYTLFKGSDYAGRDINFEQVYSLPETVEISQLNLSASLSEVVFQKITGSPSQTGDLTIRLIEQPEQQRTLYINKAGKISSALSAVDDTARVKDSRHIHFTYTGLIDVLLDNLVLTFDSGTVQEIVPISANLISGQFFWQGEVDVSGDKQLLTIKTLCLNNPDTVFCIYRDRRYNNKQLDIDLDSDPNYPGLSPTLIRYSAGGAAFQGGSLNVGEPIYQ